MLGSGGNIREKTTVPYSMLFRDFRGRNESSEDNLSICASFVRTEVKWCLYLCGRMRKLSIDEMLYNNILTVLPHFCRILKRRRNSYNFHTMHFRPLTLLLETNSVYSM